MLQSCPECGGNVSSTAPSCPHCGFRPPAYSQAHQPHHAPQAAMHAGPPSAPDIGVAICLKCSTPHAAAVCPKCGTPRPSKATRRKFWVVEIVSTVLAILGVLAGLAYMAEQDAKKERARADAIRARERAEREADQQRLRDYEAKQNEIRRELRGR